MYSKGKENKRTFETLPNIGREAHTYLYYIITHYHDLPEAVIFLQGNPFPHLPLELLLRMFNGNGRTSNYEIVPFSTSLTGGKLYNWAGKQLRSTGKTIQEWIFDNLHTTQEQGPVYWGAQFGVSKNQILKHDQKFYQDIINQFETTDDELAHFLERVWGLIFLEN